MSEIAKELGEVVPSNWCDPLLTGDSAALHGQPGAWSCHDIERLLNGIRERIQNHAALAAMVADAERYRRLRQSALTVSFNQCIAYSPGYNERDAEAMDKFIDERLGLHDAAMAQRLERS